MKRAVIFVGVAALAIGVTAAVVLAQFTDEQQSAGAVTVAGPGAIDLYICEPGPQGQPPVPGPSCGPDDNGTSNGPAGADEAIFETIEDLTPDDTTQWDIRVRNNGTLAWDLTGHDIAFTETDDPGNDCNRVPTLEPRILGKAGDPVNDNHAGFFAGWMYIEGQFAGYVVHVDPGDYEDIRLRVTIPANAGNECIDNAWDLNVGWTTSDE
jgi:hypothetical protein